MSVHLIDQSFGLGLTTSKAGVISALLEDGSLEFLTMDSLAAHGRLRPVRCDLDGDGRDEIAVSFGQGSRGIVAILQDAIDGLPAQPSDALLISTGRERYRKLDGETRIAIGDVDDDGVDELIVGFRRSGDHEVQVLDDLAAGSATAMSAMTADAGFVGTGARSIMIYPVPLF
jgi:hypothetical protein